MSMQNDYRPILTIPSSSTIRHQTGFGLVQVMLILLLVGALPRWGYSSGWGYYPSGILGLIVVVLLILALTGRL